MPHAIRPIPAALACGLSLNTFLIPPSHAAPRHSSPLSTPAAPQHAAPPECNPQPFCLLFEPQPQPSPTTAPPATKSPRKSAPKSHLKPKLKHPKTKHHTTHSQIRANNHPIILPLSTEQPKPHAYNGPYAGVIGGAQWFHHQKKSPSFGPSHVSINPYRFGPTGAIWGLAGYNFQWSNLITGFEASIGYADLASPYGALVPFHDFADASFETRFGVALDHVMAFGATGLTLGSFSPYPSSSGTKIHAGWTIGGGLEWPIAPNVNGRVEYFYKTFPDLRIGGNGVRGGFSVKF